MDEKYNKNMEYIDMKSVCRTCLAAPGSPALYHIYQDYMLHTILNNITHLQMNESDGLPNNICVDCVKCARSAYSFQQTAEKSNKKLQEYIVNKQINVKREATQNCAPEIFLLVEPNLKKSLLTNPLVDAESDFDNTIDNTSLFQNESDDSEDDFKPLNELKTAKNKLLNKKENSSIDSKYDSSCCELCNENFPNNLELEKHKEKIHTGFVQCNICSRAFTKESFLERHKIAAHSKLTSENLQSIKKTDCGESYLCKFCGFYFKREDQLVTHLTLSHNDKCGPKKRGRPSKKDILEKKIRLKSILQSMKIKKEDQEEPSEDNLELEDDTPLRDDYPDPLPTHHLEIPMDIKNECLFCYSCCKSFSDSELYDNHVKQEHSNEGCVCICKICNQSISKLTIIKKHLQDHMSMEDILNVNKKNKLQLLENHLKLMDLDEDSITDELLTNIIVEDLKNHKFDRYITRVKIDCADDNDHDHIDNISDEWSHNEEQTLKKLKKKIKLHKCYLCEQIFTRTNHILKHMAVHNYEYPFICNTCNKVFPNEELFNKHKKFQCDSASKLYQCGSCEMKFTFELSLNKHILKHHKGENVSINFLDPQTHKKEKSFFCHICNKGFYRQDHLDKHVLVHQPNEKHFECPICQKKFNRKDNLRSHSRVHEPNKEDLDSNCLCVYCGRFFSNSSNLIVHMRRHTGEKPYKCDICDKGFPRSSDLQCHRRTHTGEKPCKCTVCGKGFSRSNKLVRHMRIHTGQRPYKCTFCDRAFTQSNDLTLHIRRHTGDKPYVCGVCGDRFIQGTALQAHRRMQGHFEQGNQSVPFAANSMNNPSRDKGPHRVARVGEPAPKDEEVLKPPVTNTTVTTFPANNMIKTAGCGLVTSYVSNNVSTFLTTPGMLIQNLDVSNAISNAPLFAISQFGQEYD